MTVFSTITLISILPAIVAFPQYKAEFPNGPLFHKELGHRIYGAKAATGMSYVAVAWGYHKKSWANLCKEEYIWREESESGGIIDHHSDMTFGEAFGDPCCIWKKGDNPAFVIDPEEFVQMWNFNGTEQSTLGAPETKTECPTPVPTKKICPDKDM